MAKGETAGETPIGIDVVEGKSYYWCSCGKSLNQPMCDGSHKGTNFKPIPYKADQSKNYFSALVNKLVTHQFAMVHIILKENEYKSYSV